jgi:hypothetical protein
MSVLYYSDWLCSYVDWVLLRLQDFVDKVLDSDISSDLVDDFLGTAEYLFATTQHILKVCVVEITKGVADWCPIPPRRLM